MLTKERDNGLLPRGAFSGVLNFFTFCIGFIEGCVMNFDNFPVGKGQESVF